MNRQTLIIDVLEADKDNFNQVIAWRGNDAHVSPRTVNTPYATIAEPDVIVGYCGIFNTGRRARKDLIDVGAKQRSHKRAKHDQAGNETEPEDFPTVEKEPGHTPKLTRRVKLPPITYNTKAKRTAKRNEIKALLARVTFVRFRRKVPANRHLPVLKRYLARRGKVLIEPEEV